MMPFATIVASDKHDPPRDFTAVDQIMPHPVYATQYWIYVLNPSDAPFEKLRPLLAEAYPIAVWRHRKEAPASGVQAT